MNARNESLGDLLKSASDVSGVLSDRSAQVNTLILNANDLVGVLNDRRTAISDLLANTSAVSQQLTGLVHDNEKELAPTLARLNDVSAMLEKNRDNLLKALPGFVKFQLTQGETVSNGFYYTAFIPNVQPAQLLQPFLDYAFGFRTRCEQGAAAGQRRSARRARKRVPRNAIPGGSR